jgi:Ca2+-binding EF-hand superfamily protein
LFCLQQDCPNGELTPAKFVDMYKMFFPSGNAEEFCDHVFRTFDMDKNGFIDFKVSRRTRAFIAFFVTNNLSGLKNLFKV